jgi:hypothetical protein
MIYFKMLSISLFNIKNNTGCDLTVSKVFSYGQFLPPGDKKKGLATSTKGFLRIFKNNSPYLEKKDI